MDEGARLNLERSLRVGDELGGHIVTGHVDAVATVTASIRTAARTRLTLARAAGLEQYLAAKGSITLDGVSLTVNEVRKWAGRPVSRLISSRTPLEATTLGGIAAGRQLNVEIDMLARYLERMMAANHIGVSRLRLEHHIMM